MVQGFPLCLELRNAAIPRATSALDLLHLWSLDSDCREGLERKKNVWRGDKWVSEEKKRGGVRGWEECENEGGWEIQSDNTTVQSHQLHPYKEHRGTQRESKRVTASACLNVSHARFCTTCITLCHTKSILLPRLRCKCAARPAALRSSFSTWRLRASVNRPV